MNILGRGLESLIPKKADSPVESPVLNVLDEQNSLDEGVYRFHDDTRERVAVPAAGDTSPTARPSSVASSETQPRRHDSVFWIDVAKIEPNPLQPRRTFDMTELTSLASSIREHGVLQPLLVTKMQIDSPRGLDVKYQLIAGERRWRAAKLAGVREVPVMVRVEDTGDQTKLELALIENVQREDLNVMERARAFAELVNQFNLTHRDIAQRVGKSREYVSNSFRLLTLPEEVQTALANGSLSEGHGRVILMLSDEEKQRALFQEITGAQMNVRDATMAARAISGKRLRAGLVSRRGTPALDPDSRALQRRLEEALGTRVSLVKRGSHGRIIVEFYSDEELNGILERIAGHDESYV